MLRCCSNFQRRNSPRTRSIGTFYTKTINTMWCNRATSTYYLRISITLQKERESNVRLDFMSALQSTLKGPNCVAAVRTLCIRKYPQSPNAFSLISLSLLYSHSLFLHYQIQATECQSLWPTPCK